MYFQKATFGGLTCQVFDTLPSGATPSLIAVFCHGFGAPGTDLVGLGPELAAQESAIAGSVRFLFPEAPVSLESRGGYGGRAWWHLDIEARLQAIERGEIRNLRNDVPDGLSMARQQMMALVSEVSEAYHVDASRIVLGGFSQGAMIATDVALHLERRPAGLILYSGTLMCEAEWRRLAAVRGALPVFQSHGRQDPILPFLGAEWLRDLLAEGGLPVEFFPFQGPHTIPREALARSGSLLARLATER